MKKAQLIFDITDSKTEVTVIDTKGISEKLDITDTKMEKALVRLIKQIHVESQAKEIMKAIDINTWQEDISKPSKEFENAIKKFV